MTATPILAGTPPADSAQDDARSRISLDGDRCMVGLEAAWEIHALSEAVNELCCSATAEPNPETSQLSVLRLQVRGLTQRMGQLACVLMSVLDEDDETRNLYKKVHGHAPTAEAAHHG